MDLIIGITKVTFFLKNWINQFCVPLNLFYNFLFVWYSGERFQSVSESKTKAHVFFKLQTVYISLFEFPYHFASNVVIIFILWSTRRDSKWEGSNERKESGRTVCSVVCAEKLRDEYKHENNSELKLFAACLHIFIFFAYFSTYTEYVYFNTIRIGQEVR